MQRSPQIVLGPVPPDLPPREDRIVGIIILCVAGATTLLDTAIFLLIAGLSKEASKDNSWNVSTEQANMLRQGIAVIALMDLGLAVGNAAVGLAIMNSRRWAFVGGIVMAVVDVLAATLGPFGMCFSLGYILAAIMAVYCVMRLSGRFGDLPNR